MPSGKLLTRATAAVFLAAALVAAAGFLATDITRRAGAMRASITMPADVRDARRGMRIEPVVRLERRAAGSLHVAEILQSIDGADFRETGTRLEFVVDRNATFAMGAASDLKPGAVAQVRGTLDGAHRLHADRIVLLTRVVHVTQGGQ